MTTLEQLQNISPAVLLDVVRQDQRSPDFEIGNWTVRLLTGKGNINPEGLFCFEGNGRDGHGVRSWSVVLKILMAPDRPAPENSRWYWKRELPAYQSGLLSQWFAPIATPRCYGTAEQAGNVWIWMERVTDRAAGKWGTAQFAFAVRQLGRSNGTYLTGALLPDLSWLARDAPRSWITAFPPEQGWGNSYVEKHIIAPVRERIVRLWDERERFLSALARLPQTFSHFDFHRRNLFTRERVDGQPELVAMDWQTCGIGPLGADFAMAVAMSCLLFDWEPAAAQELETAIYDAWLSGLRDAGWKGDAHLARLGYAAWVALWVGVIAPGAIAAFTADDMRAWSEQLLGRIEDELASGWTTLCQFALDRADEARQLMDQLKLA